MTLGEMLHFVNLSIYIICGSGEVSSLLSFNITVMLVVIEVKTWS